MTCSSLSMHEAGHTLVCLLHAPQGGVVTVHARHDELETVPQTPPASAQQAIDQMLAGAIVELLIKAKGHIIAARTAIQVCGWAVALKSDAAVYDLALMGPTLTDQIVLASFDRIAPHLDFDSLEDIAQRIEQLAVGQSASFARKHGH